MNDKCVCRECVFACVSVSFSIQEETQFILKLIQNLVCKNNYCEFIFTFFSIWDNFASFFCIIFFCSVSDLFFTAKLAHGIMYSMQISMLIMYSTPFFLFSERKTNYVY